MQRNSTNVDYAGVGQDANWGCGGNGQFWVVTQPRSLAHLDRWPVVRTTNPDGRSIFTQPTAGTFNTQRVRNLIYQPGYQNWNMGLFKTIPVNEKLRFQFRAEAYNV